MFLFAYIYIQTKIQCRRFSIPIIHFPKTSNRFSRALCNYKLINTKFNKTNYLAVVVKAGDITGSASNSSSISIKLVPFTGSPPIPTQVL